MRTIVREQQAEARMWPQLHEQLTCQILHVPEHAVAGLKASGGGAGGEGWGMSLQRGEVSL